MAQLVHLALQVADFARRLDELPVVLVDVALEALRRLLAQRLDALPVLLQISVPVGLLAQLFHILLCRVSPRLQLPPQTATAAATGACSHLAQRQRHVCSRQERAERRQEEEPWDRQYRKVQCACAENKGTTPKTERKKRCEAGTLVVVSPAHAPVKVGQRLSVIASSTQDTKLPATEFKAQVVYSTKTDQEGEGRKGTMDEDFLLALRLQAEWEAEDNEVREVSAVPGSRAGDLPRALSVVDEAWELLDPSPDVRGLFMQFNESLFWGRLAAVEVKWSPRMTLCAGVCSYEGRGGMCSIRLSEPLLKLRPRKDLVETLLHEMIHALLFVTNNDKDHDSHGPEFCKHMHRINRLTGASVTIYHNFHDEVDSYRQHWWRCNGPCQSRKPYFGYVKRAMNRPPSANDIWWSEHQQTCGGTFTKIKEPESYSKNGKDKIQQAKFLADNKGKVRGVSMQSIIPFTGKGYVLGGKTSMSPEKTTSQIIPQNRESLSSPHHSPASLTRPTSQGKPEVEQHVSSRSSCYDKNSFVSSLVLPKVSVANKKAYTSVNGSPVKNFKEGKSCSSSANAMWGLSLKRTPEKSISEPSASASSSQTASYRKSSPLNGGPPKRAKLEDTSAFENYFKKTSPSVERKSDVGTSGSSVSDQNRKVCCPVCQCEVLEAKINQHLDVCL
uniref:DNA-dependent metalloprotease SPRTN n=1 Tax=Salvator merianae TaxID=96440 RepID=A0A8D0EAH8_SALMN